ncbi:MULTISPECIES: hypothetical protein [unclassified Streptomyces]|uniref:hypothetical protein n=1 Tax=unclassified Streptomyces TaxID=2593676 RepID=UPI00136E0190|nr:MULTISPECIES: hypothetical protein [unclassified Streptomyces]NEA00170.1 hypothetical protein [Streptomyces sp. SID10116]MYY80881.1 hypothetical protein [Streptomyces sp. SID335]MYZ15963.1 hypothetical protein [Streptomyces sp. SID337]NDZ85660.1 hypothetical protein [Streptomyces sp. SID10115]NEB50007.1 hypothetical protein [Streptomyces sp. SID339]
MSDSPAHEADRHRQAWVLKAGQWSLVRDPVAGQETKFRGYEEAVKAAGYTVWTGAGEVYTVPLTLTVWSRSEEPSFLFDMEGAVQTQTVYAATLPDALTLLNQLAPTLQALAVTDQIAGAEPENMSILADVLDKLHDRRRGKDGRLIQK